MLVITQLVTRIIPKDSRQGKDSNEDCRPDSLIAAGRIMMLSQGSFLSIIYLFIEFIINNLVCKALTHEDGNLYEEKDNMDPYDYENPNDLKESSTPEVNSSSIV